MSTTPRPDYDNHEPLTSTPPSSERKPDPTLPEREVDWSWAGKEKPRYQGEKK